jgi:hypothetical protein
MQSNGLVVKAAIELALKENEKAFQGLDSMLRAYHKAFGDVAEAPLNKLVAAKAVVKRIRKRNRRVLAKDKANGHTPGKRGRKPGFSPEQVSKIQEEHKGGAPVLKLAKAYKVTPPTIYRALAQ